MFTLIDRVIKWEIMAWLSLDAAERAIPVRYSLGVRRASLVDEH